MGSETLGKLEASKGWVPKPCAVKGLLCLGTWLRPGCGALEVDGDSATSQGLRTAGDRHDNGFCGLVWQLPWPGVLRTEDALPVLGRKDLCG